MDGLTILAAAVGTLGVVSAPGVAQPVNSPPIELTLEWAGAPCNPEGTISVTIRNVGDQALAFPANARINFGDVFMIGLKTSDGARYTSMGDGPGVPRALHEYQESEVRIAEPNGEAMFPLVLDLQPGAIPHLHDETREGYEAVRKSGGAFWMVYGLEDFGNFGKQKFLFYFHGVREDPVIFSNKLTCPPAG